MRRGLRKGGFRAESLVGDVESEIVQWLQTGGVVLHPDAATMDDLNAQGTPIGYTETIFEVSRTPLQLVWYIDDDSYARYIVHCCARYHDVVSFSKLRPILISFYFPFSYPRDKARTPQGGVLPIYFVRMSPGRIIMPQVESTRRQRRTTRPSQTTRPSRTPNRIVQTRM